MDTQRLSTETPSHVQRFERSDLMFRIDLKLEGQQEFHCCSGNVSKGGVFIHLAKECQSKVMGRRGVCHIFVGQEFFEMPFDVVRAEEHGVGIHVPAGYDEAFNRFLDRVQTGDAMAMGLEYAVGESIHPR